MKQHERFDAYQDSNEIIPPSTYIPMVREWMELVREGYRLQTNPEPESDRNETGDLFGRA